LLCHNLEGEFRAQSIQFKAGINLDENWDSSWYHRQALLLSIGMSQTPTRSQGLGSCSQRIAVPLPGVSVGNRLG
jgi:hypothetical protein